MEITEARWRGDTIVINSSWRKGVSTLACKLLEGRDAGIVVKFGL